MSFLLWPNLFILSGAISIALHSFLVPYWTPSDMGASSSGVISFCLFILFMGLSQQKFWCALPVLPPVDHILSELFPVTHLSWVALQGMAHSFTELHKSLRHIKAVIHEGTEGVARLNKPHLFSPQIFNDIDYVSGTVVSMKQNEQNEVFPLIFFWEIKN